MHLARFIWMQQLQTLYETEIQWPKGELWVFQPPRSKRAVGFCPKSFILHGITIFWTLVMPKPLTWSVAEMESSLHLCRKSSIFRFRPNLKSNTVWKKPNFARFSWVLPSKKFSKHSNKTAFFAGCDSPEIKPCNVEFHESYVFCLFRFILIVVKLQQTSDLTSRSLNRFSTVFHLVDRYCTA